MLKMTVGELMEILKTCDSNARVVVNVVEFGPKGGVKVIGHNYIPDARIVNTGLMENVVYIPVVDSGE